MYFKNCLCKTMFRCYGSVLFREETVLCEHVNAKIWRLYIQSKTDRNGFVPLFSLERNSTVFLLRNVSKPIWTLSIRNGNHTGTIWHDETVTSELVWTWSKLLLINKKRLFQFLLLSNTHVVPIHPNILYVRNGYLYKNGGGTLNRLNKKFGI